MTTFPLNYAMLYPKKIFDEYEFNEPNVLL